MRVLVVERDAHVHAGHFPNRFAALASGFAELGCDVDVLTQRGWLLARDRPGVPFRVHDYPWWATQLDRAVLKVRKRWRHPIVFGLGDMFSTALGAVAARRFDRRHGRADLVVVLSYDTLPGVFVAVAGDLPLLFYLFDGPTPWSDVIDRAASRWRRRQLSLLTAGPVAAAGWSARHPSAAVTVTPISGVAPPVHGSRAGARRALGLRDDDRVALFFGSGHNAYDADVVQRAFALDMLDMTLVVGGKVNRLLDGWRDDRVVRFPGFVSPAQRDQLFAAADVVILSFRDGYERDSGTLMDALSYGRPVVASRGSSAAKLVERHHLGVLFVPGDERSLVHALRQVPSEHDREVLESARAELSDRGVAARFLAIARGVSGGRGSRR